MSSKQIIVLVAATAFTGLLVTGGAFYLWHTQPQSLGLPAPIVEVDTSVHVPTESEILHHRNDSLERIAKSMHDSLSGLNSQVTSLRDQQKHLSEQLEQNKKEQEKKEKAWNDTTRLKNLRVSAEMYEKAQPAEAAKILAKSNSEYVAGVLNLMKRKSAAKVLEQLPVNKAVEVSKLLSKN